MTPSKTLDIAVDLVYGVDARTEMLLQIEAADTFDQTLINSQIDLSGAHENTAGPAEEGLGLRRCFAVTDELTCTYHATVDIKRTAVDLSNLSHTALTDLPHETIRYLMPSRYCAPADFAPTLDDFFDGLSGGALIDASRAWLVENFSYVPGASSADTTASDTFMHRQGICRDFAHVVIAMARCRGIPARFVACYAPDVTPPDFHAVAEVWLDGGWHLVDATGMADASETARIGVGMDAAEVAFLTIFGNAELRRQTVSVTRSAL